MEFFKVKTEDSDELDKLEKSWGNQNTTTPVEESLLWLTLGTDDVLTIERLRVCNTPLLKFRIGKRKKKSF